MALRASYTEISDYEDLVYIPEGDLYRLNPKTESLVFHTIPLGLPRITEDNWQEFAIRLHMWDLAHGRTTHYLTPDDVKAHIGLRTNASPMTPTQFGKHVLRIMRERATEAV